jgi:hypothetical protein
MSNSLKPGAADWEGARSVGVWNGLFSSDSAGRAASACNLKFWCTVFVSGQSGLSRMERFIYERIIAPACALTSHFTYRFEIRFDRTDDCVVDERRGRGARATQESVFIGAKNSQKTTKSNWY